MQPVSAEQFAGMLRTFSDTAFRLETQPAYFTSTAEREALALFLAGAPRPPGEFPVWQTWLDEMKELVTDAVQKLQGPPRTSPFAREARLAHS